MSSPLDRELEIIWSETDVEVVLEAHERILSLATKEDLPLLVDALESNRNIFWTRELLSEPIAYLGGADHLPELFDALEKNTLEGHDNDSLLHFLAEIAEMNPIGCRVELDRLLKLPDFAHSRHAEWLLEFCN